MNGAMKRMRAYKVAVYINMLGVLIEYIIMCYLDSTSIVAIKYRSTVITDTYVL